MAVANIGHKDLAWTVVATIFKLGAGVLLFPFILNKLPAETVGVWTIFTTVTSLTYLLDFGFKASFARNVAYVFSGVRDLKRTGYESVTDTSDSAVDYNLLKSAVRAMRFFYSRIAFALLLLLLFVGSFYIRFLLRDYQGDTLEIYIAWTILCLLNTYNLYTLYFEALMMGRGLVKNYNKFVFIGNIVYVFGAALLIMFDFGLIAIVSSQLLSILIVRMLSYRCFFNKTMKEKLLSADDSAYRSALKAITPNAIKVGLTSLGGFIINKSATLIGSLFLPLTSMASYGITLQLITVVSSIGAAYSNVFMPKVFQWRIENNYPMIRRAYLKSIVVLVSVCLSAGVSIFFFGDWALELLNSKTHILGGALLVVMLIAQFLEINHAVAADYLLSKNEVPFFKASLFSAAATLLLLIIFVVILNMGLWGMILAPALAQLCYQNWKWPYETIKELFVINI